MATGTSTLKTTPTTMDRKASQSLAFMLPDGACGALGCLAGESVHR
jgi:hypothetical protein